MAIFLKRRKLSHRIRQGAVASLTISMRYNKKIGFVSSVMKQYAKYDSAPEKRAGVATKVKPSFQNCV
jgi:hypothetical protein